MKVKIIRVFVAAIIAGLAATTASASEFCRDYNYGNGKKVAASDLREVTIAATGSLEVDGGRNGGIRVTGENRKDVLVRACIRAWAASDAEAKNLVSTTRIETSPVVRAVNPNEKARSSVSFEIRVPMQTSLKLKANNGGIGISSVDGNLEFTTRNGGVKLANVAGSVKGSTTNGGVKIALSGNSWRGSGLDVTTTNGGVKLSLPSNYAANIEAATVNGGFKSDFPGLQVKKEGKNRYYSRKKSVSASLNGGGAPIRVKTTNGGVKIGAAKAVEQ